MSHYDYSGHTTNYSNITTGANSNQHNGNVYGGVTNNYNNRPATSMASRRSAGKRRKEDYTVGWICALAEPELQASRLLLDAEHEDMQVPGRYQYIFGEMNGHHVVMGCLPDGQMGENAAASAAENMATTFPQLRIGLLVGIGGGVPSEDRDIRLGDVVVSRPDMNNSNGGVVQYDLGKALAGGGFMRIGQLNLPPTTLLGGLSKLRSQKPSQSKFPEYLKSFVQHQEDLPQYAKRPDSADRLFESEYEHPKGKRTCKDCTDEVDREPRAGPLTQIHYGTIASGNQVMKDAKRRDELAAQHNAICFEMEAAGLMNQFPCIVIRGICDYCDSHKNKSWQPYAAAVAASFAKELLRNIAPADVATEATIDSTIRDATPQPVHLLPDYSDDHFVGRSDVLEILERKLLRSPGNHTRAALAGTRGVGKSRTALRFAENVQRTRPGVSVLWINASGIESFTNGYYNIAAHLVLPGYDDARTDVLDLVFKWLRSPASGTWLLILDNANDIQFTHQTSQDLLGRPFMLSSYMPHKPNCSILLTTYDGSVARRFVHDRKAVLNIKRMEERDAIKLLQDTIKPKVCSLEEAEQLVRRLGCLPLAITQATIYISAHKLMSVSGYSRLLDDSESLVLAAFPDGLAETGPGTGAPDSVIMTLMLSLDFVKLRHPTATDLLSWLCFLDQHDIPIDILVGSAATDDIEILDRFFLVHIRMEKRTADIHTLVQVAARAWVPRDQVEIVNREALRRLVENYPSGEFSHWRTCQELDPHAASILSLRKFGILESAESHRLRLTYHRCTYRRHRGMYNEARTMAQALLDELHSTRGPQDPDVMQIQAFIAQSNLESGEWSRIDPQQEKALEQIYGGDIPVLAYFVRKHINQGQGARAEELCHRLIDKSVHEFTAQGRATLAARSELSRAFTAQGKLIDAKRVAISVLEARQRLFRINDPDALASASDLAGVFVAEGRLASAEALYYEVWQRRNFVLSEKHPLTSESISNLAAIHIRQNRFDSAQQLIAQALSMRRSALGDRHPATLESQHDAAYAWWQSGDLQRAHTVSAANLEHLKGALGDEDPLVLTVKSCLAKIKLTMGDLGGARDLITAAATGLSRQYRDCNPGTLTASDVLSRIEGKQTRFASAWEKQAEIYREMKSSMTYQISSIIDCMLYMSAWHETSGARDLAMELVEDAVSLSRRAGRRYLAGPSMRVSITIDPRNAYSMAYAPAKFDVATDQDVQPLFQNNIDRVQRVNGSKRRRMLEARSRSTSRRPKRRRIEGLNRRWSIA